MNLAYTVFKFVLHSIPRVSGGEPWIADDWRRVKKYSPRERG